MSSADIWLTIALLTFATVVTRTSFFLLASARLPARVQQALRYAPPAALAAIVIPDLLLNGGAGGAAGITGIDWTNPRLLAGIGATLFFLATRHLLGTIVAGMALFSAFRLLL
ncbi:AzlD domain-containing protein [Noviherbaspirillum suwonense]|jgi:branched-subunit amino acid transport protein|uniref:Branched-chain amino acid transport protein n=1 Tax=Noviherbaspirillum suwonense TaxID=1224511 RepID=A0ABY1PTC4_9BURK|nr:AzlD domain-containing protein [Noviherbaspirillum suwonense]SMP44417.1 Branched-chain amino acid transport protein [Noviherbaspirillum suwonense]